MTLWKKRIIAGFILGLLIVAVACSGGQATTPSASYSQYQLEYQLLSKYPNYFWCDPDVYPIAREGQEQANALAQFPNIQANQAEFSAILEHLNLPNKSDYTDTDKLSIYREHKLLTYAITIASSATNSYDFSLRTGENQGLRIAGTIDSTGRVNVITQEPSFNTCPICLAKGTLIETPSGLIPVEQLQPGMTVWTKDASGNKVAKPIVKTSSTRVPNDFQVVRIKLEDGRTITASPGHPTADMKAIGDLQAGDTLDSGLVVSIQRIRYNGDATFDILPEGVTGVYQANGIWLMSTLR